MTRNFRFTGWHMLATLVLFFGTVIAVNVTMATLATRTFGGVVVENSYVASQEFNGWLKEARDQARLGWTARALTKDQRAEVELTRSTRDSSEPLNGARVTATARHPLGRMPDVDLIFDQIGPGRYIAHAPLPAGRWRLHLSVVIGKNRADFIRDIAA